MLTNSHDPIVVKWAKFALEYFKRENVQPVSLQTQAYWQLLKTNGADVAKEVLTSKNIGVESIK